MILVGCLVVIAMSSFNIGEYDNRRGKRPSNFAKYKGQGN